MRIKTRIFDEIDIAEEKVIELPKGIIGFPELKKFALVHDSEKKDSGVSWFQSLDEPNFALPVVDPLVVLGEYNPTIDDSQLKEIGELSDENILVLVTMSIPADKIEDMSINLKGPIIINAQTRKAAQVIVDNDNYKVKFPIYEKLKNESK